MKRSICVSFFISLVTCYVFSHFHYLLLTGTEFAIIGGFIHWFSLFIEVTVNSKFLQFITIFIGINIIFLQHLLALRGMSRRYSDYPGASTTWNILLSIESLYLTSKNLRVPFYYLRQKVFHHNELTLSIHWKWRKYKPYCD